MTPRPTPTRHPDRGPSNLPGRPNLRHPTPFRSPRQDFKSGPDTGGYGRGAIRRCQSAKPNDLTPFRFSFRRRFPNLWGPAVGEAARRRPFWSGLAPEGRGSVSGAFRACFRDLTVLQTVLRSTLAGRL